MNSIQVPLTGDEKAGLEDLSKSLNMPIEELVKLSIKQFFELYIPKDKIKENGFLEINDVKNAKTFLWVE